MKCFYVLASLACLQISCTTIMWEPSTEPSSEEVPQEVDGFRVGEFAKRLSDKNRYGLLEERQILEKKMSANPGWEDQFKLAMIMMSVDEQGKDYEKIHDLLAAVVKNESAHEEVRSSARWLQIINQQVQIATVQWQAETEKNAVLQQKLHALSTIEKKLDKRSRQEMR
ncbi:MAG: hypothetical protein ACOH5I_14070 [Oligoflexus sp.]